MSRTSKRHNRNIQRQRRNKGPEMLSQAADNKLKENAQDFVTALYDASMKRDATAANLLLDLAESAEYADSTVVVRQACSILDQWAKEPQVVDLETAPRLGAAPQQRLLTDGAADGTRNPEGSSPQASEEILDAEVG